MKYKCGLYIYDLPETSCVFCQNAEIMWDYTNGIYMILCPKHKVDTIRMIRGCDNKIPYPEGTEFSK